MNCLKNRSKIYYLVEIRFKQSYYEKIIERLRVSKINDSVLYESFYLVGVYYLFVKIIASLYITLIAVCHSREKSGEFDERYVRILYNLGVAYIGNGDIKKHEEISSKSLEIEKKINGDSSPLLATIYMSLGLGLFRAAGT